MDNMKVKEKDRNNNCNNTTKETKFREKIFVVRDSILTNEFNSSGRILYNYFSSLFILLAIGTWIRDTWHYGNPLHHTWLIWWNFNRFPITMLAWSIMHLSTVFFIYYGMTLWSLIPSKNCTIQSQKFFFFSYITYLICLFYLPIKWNIWMELNPACSYIITCENTRLAMKVHSFVRENILLATRRKKQIYEDKISSIDGWPTLKQFNYFMFAPTFIYKNSYPSYPTRSWKKVGNYFIQCLICIYIVDLIFMQQVYPYFSEMNYNENNIVTLIYAIFPSIIPGMICLMMLFYGILHCWLNMFAEALQFGDRLFYDNWWKSKNMAQYYRDWNLVVHEWLYSYIYKDLSTFLKNNFKMDKNGRKFSQTLVFFLSAFFHEYWFGISLRVFYPIMFFLYFICGGIFFFVSRLIKNDSIWNITMFCNLLIGTGMFVACYSMEWYAKERCPSQKEGLWNWIPKQWNCQQIN
ncbi:O-acyltransferase [Strongyloides ratti]|uniref:O-acyltransferase n=1 Tax=Strongyloides ratti TaxID=34506 RepID=A0A090KX51_STRRB|nr:O-acyltransferase [Strongyloides ratti]CEF62080.1 O-acyltransferase [Strongyloides ratti]